MRATHDDAKVVPTKTGSGDESAVASDDAPPLPNEAPPLPDEAPPAEADDGWEYYYADQWGCWYFYNRFTQVYQWENPRVPEATGYQSYDSYPTSTAPQGTSSAAPGTSSPPKRPHGGYNPKIHGNYDPNADYAIEARKEEERAQTAAALAAGLPDPHAYSYGRAHDDYTASAHFNRFNGRFQQPGMGPEMHNDESKSRRQMNSFFDVDAAANSHDGRSLKEERRNRVLTKKELKAFKEKRRAKKEEKRRAWLRD